MAKILTIEDEENLRFSIRRTLERGGHEVAEANNLTAAADKVAKNEFDLVLTDVMLGAENGMELVKRLRADGFDGVIVVMTAFGTVEAAVAAMKEGADDYIQKPIGLAELSIQVTKWLEHRQVTKRVRLYERMERTRELTEQVVGESKAWRQTVDTASRLAELPLPEAGGETESGAALPAILLVGETGTGKGVIARWIHREAVRLSGKKAPGATEPPFVHVNCSALPASLVEGELFGHEKGAFTDARESKAGLFEMAEGGTIFLDEISEMPLELQAKLLLVVEQGAFRRVGGGKERSVRARVIAASNQDLEGAVRAGKFRRDLLYRLNAFTLRLPPLRERPGDAVKIAQGALARLSRRYGRAGLSLGASVIRAIEAHDWPGNVRELVNAVQRAAMLCQHAVLEPEDLGLSSSATSLSRTGGAPSVIVTPSAKLDRPAQAGVSPPTSLQFNFKDGVHTAEAVEKELIMQALKETRGNVSKAAKLIGMQRSSMRYRIERFGLDNYVLEVSSR